MKLAYRDYGSGKPFLILHGLFGQSDNWNTLAKKFSEQGYCVYTIDLRNHGLSPHSDVWNYNVMADDIHAFLSDHCIQEPILLGHSMGGKVLLHYELKYPDQGAKLIIADIAARYYEPHHQQIINALHAVDFSIIKNRKEAESILNDYISDFGTKQFLLKNIYWKEPDQMAWRFNLKVISETIDNIGAAVPFFKSETPTLIIRGSKSDYINEKDLEDFSKRFIKLKFINIADAGHWLHAEKPNEFFEAVLNFIKD